jgi:hypothetical protein
MGSSVQLVFSSRIEPDLTAILLFKPVAASRSQLVSMLRTGADALRNPDDRRPGLPILPYQVCIIRKTELPIGATARLGELSRP